MQWNYEVYPSSMFKALVNNEINSEVKVKNSYKGVSSFECVHFPFN
jgi:hypothetical protein